jgi:hypothetical protein
MSSAMEGERRDLKIILDVDGEGVDDPLVFAGRSRGFRHKPTPLVARARAGGAR